MTKPTPLSVLATARSERPQPAMDIRPPASRHELDFLEFIKTLRRGEVVDEADQQLAELIDALSRLQGKGSLTVKFNFTVNKAGQLECDPSVSIKKPVRSLAKGIFWATQDGRLSRRDPDQMDIEDEIDRRRSTED